jgi:hypothetical protein
MKALLLLALTACVTDARDPLFAADAGGDVRQGVLPDAVASCTNHDGVIARAEVTLAANQSITMRIAADAAFDPHSWDLSGPLSGDHDAAVTTLDPTGAWWSAQFSDATYAARLSESADLLGVFRATATELQLVGG